MSRQEAPRPGSNDNLTFATMTGYSDPRWTARARYLLTQRDWDSQQLKDEVRIFFRILRAARRERVMLLHSCFGKFRPSLLAACAMSLWPARLRPIIVMTGPMYHRYPGLRGALHQLAVRLADRSICLYAVQSLEELDLFPKTWCVSPAKTRYCPYFLTLTKRDIEEDIAEEDYIFAGGDSHRDYVPLVTAARSLPEYRFVMATSLLDDRCDLPPNVTAGFVPHHEFIRLMRAAAAVIVPVRLGLTRAAGQQTYLNAMQLGKPTIVTEVAGVRDHIKAGEDALVVDGSPEGYIEALRWIFDPANHDDVARLRAAARRASQPFTLENRVTILLDIVDEAANSSP